MSTPEQIKMNIAELDNLIKTAHPRMPVLLKDIHKVLMADADTVTLMTEEEVSVIVSGLKKQTATEIATSLMKGGSKKAALKNTSVDDL
jgi:hypothetical protein